MKKFMMLFSIAALLFASFAVMPVNSAIAAPPDRGGLLKGIEVVGEATDGTPFEGKLDIQSFSYDADGQLWASVLVDGEMEPITVPATLSKSSIASSSAFGSLALVQVSAVCDILFLELGPLDLDLLGLVVNLDQIVLNIDAVSGPGNLLGNLLCQVAGLLDGGGPLARILQLIDRINNLLG